MRINLKSQKGFSLVELIVVVAIFLVITGVVLYNQNKFSSDISISNVTYAIALEIRQAQVYGILVRQSTETGLSEEDRFDKAYGVHFEKSEPEPIKFNLFSDDNDNLMYTGDQGNTSDNDEILSSHLLDEGNIISDICTYSNQEDDSGKKCFSNSFINSADIVFKRPDPRAIITDSESGDATENRQKLVITVLSSLGDRERIITVLGSGQISITNPSTP